MSIVDEVLRDKRMMESGDPGHVLTDYVDHMDKNLSVSDVRDKLTKEFNIPSSSFNMRNDGLFFNWNGHPFRVVKINGEWELDIL